MTMHEWHQDEHRMYSTCFVHIEIRTHRQWMESPDNLKSKLQFFLIAPSSLHMILNDCFPRRDSKSCLVCFVLVEAMILAYAWTLSLIATTWCTDCIMDYCMQQLESQSKAVQFTQVAIGYVQMHTKCYSHNSNLTGVPCLILAWS